MNGRYDPFGNGMGTTGTATSVYGFTGEQTDATGLVYLRARYYAPMQGRFTTRDTWEGDSIYPQSANKWSYTENDPVNHTDPSGKWLITVWAAAFIEPKEIVFPHPNRGDLEAHWHGDDRGFYDGGALPKSSRVYHQIIVETNPFVPNPVVRNRGDTYETRVKWNFLGITGEDIGKADAPPSATVTRKEGDYCYISVNLTARAPNPLTPPGTPPIPYDYELVFDVCEGSVMYSGSHGQFPWYELYVSGVGPIVQDSPNGPSMSPADLFVDQAIGNTVEVPFSYKRFRIPAPDWPQYVVCRIPPRMN